MEILLLAAAFVAGSLITGTAVWIYKNKVIVILGESRNALTYVIDDLQERLEKIEIK